MSLSELPTRDFSTQDDQVLLLACEDEVVMRACDDASEVDMELRAIAEAAEAVEHLDDEF